MVNLLQGEQRSKAYLAVNPQGKVPAIVVRNVQGLPDCCLYESQAIVEWLEEVPFPPSVLESGTGTGITLFPTDPELKVQVKMWQYWELSLAEEFWPLSRQQVDGVLWRWLYSRPQFEAKLKEWCGGDAFYEMKARAMFNGSFLSTSSVRRHILRILKGFSMLEASLQEKFESRVSKDRSGNEEEEPQIWLVGGAFSQADIAVYPRLVKAPQNGILSTQAQRALFPRVLSLFNTLANRKAFAPFKERDATIWGSGVFPRFASLELGWWGYILPWSAIIAVGNWRSGVSFKRFTLADFQDEMSQVRQDTSLSAIPTAVAPPDDPPTLYYATELPMSCAVQVMVAEMNIPGLVFKRVQTLTLDTLKPQSEGGIKELNPFGELPVLVFKGRAVYGPQIIIEFLMETFPECSAAASPLLPPLAPGGTAPERATTRACVRRWFGWVRTAYYYQVAHVYEALWWGPTLRDVFGSGAVGREKLKAALPGGTEDTVAALEAFDAADAAATTTLDGNRGAEERAMRQDAFKRVGPYIEDLRERLGYVDKQLAAAQGGFLCSGGGEKEEATYADLFVLPIVLLAAKYVSAMDQHQQGDAETASAATATGARQPAWMALLAARYPLTSAWVQRCFERGGRNGWCAKLCKEMLVLHGRPNIAKVSPEFGYDFERVHGLVYDPFIREEAVDLLREHYESRPGDVFVATYPKAGTTWLQTVVSLLLHNGDATKVSAHPVLQKQCPWIDASFLRGPVKKLAGPRPYLDWHILEDLNQAGIHPRVPVEVQVEEVDGDDDTKCDDGCASGSTEKKQGRGKRRVFKTHAPVELFPVDLSSPTNLHPDTKIVVVVRNVKDVAVSLFKHSTSIPAHNYKGPWEDFLPMFLRGEVCEGSWFEHTLGWWRAYTEVNSSSSATAAATTKEHEKGAAGRGNQIFWMPFEELKADPKFWITELASFLEVNSSPAVVDKVLAGSNFDAMSSATKAQGGDSAEAKSRFANGGKAGGWSKLFTAPQSKAVDDLYAQRVNELTAPGLKFDFGLDPYTTSAAAPSSSSS